MYFCVSTLSQINTINMDEDFNRSGIYKSLTCNSSAGIGTKVKHYFELQFLQFPSAGTYVPEDPFDFMTRQ